MQATKVKVGQEYATARGKRVRIMGPGRPEAVSYGRPVTYFPCQQLTMQGLLMADGTGLDRIAAKDLLGPWDDYQEDLRARDAEQEVKQKRQKAIEDEMRDILGSFGIAHKQIVYQAHYASEEHASVTIHLSTLRELRDART